MKFSLLHGDCLEKMKELPSDSIDAVITDPPYGLEFMGKDGVQHSAQSWRRLEENEKRGV